MKDLFGWWTSEYIALIILKVIFFLNSYDYYFFYYFYFLVDGATISKKVTFFVDNYSDKPVRQALLENLPDLKDAIIEALKNALRGKSPSYSFEKVMASKKF